MSDLTAQSPLVYDGLKLLLGFVIGWFTQLIALRKMFTGKDEFDSYKKDQERGVTERRKSREKTLADFKVQVEAECRLKMSACGHGLASDLGEVKEDLRETRKDIKMDITALRGEIRDVMAMLMQKNGIPQ